MGEGRRRAMRPAEARMLRYRPAILLVGGLSSALANPKLQEGDLLFWLIVLAVGATGLVALLGLSPRLERFARYASPAVGMLGWGAFATFTGGPESPFVAAFILEIVVAGLTTDPRGVAWVTGNALAVMALVERLYGWESLGLFFVEAVFVGAIGILGATMARRRIAGEVALRAQGDELGARLDALQRELEDERVISRVGENVARLAHGLKNAVHSLRGFVGLLEPELGSGPGARAALKGLHTAIDDLEKLARLTLAEREPGDAASAAAPGQADRTGGDRARSGETASGPRDLAPGAPPAGHARVAEAVAAAHAELRAASPDVEWRVVSAAGGDALAVAIDAAPLCELLVILMRNGVEAMDGKGRGTVEYGANGDFGMLLVSDEGPGFAPEDLAKIFQPGYTTKPKGSGFGLFLAKRIVEDHGGALALESGEAGGARVRVELPRAGARED